jgi:excisionase family DNA binding protein
LTTQFALIDSPASIAINTRMKRHLGVSEVARIIGKERSTVVRWIQSGKFGRINKVGNEYQIPHEKFHRWWEDNMMTGGK